MDLSDGAWTPARVAPGARGPEVEWCYTGEERFIDPFFEQTLERAVRRPFSLLFRPRTPIDALADLVEPRAPTGLLFHSSRCGSTLVTQMLAASPRNLVLSEPRPLDTILRWPAGVEERVRWLRLLVGALGRPAGDGGYVIKLDAWSTLALPLVRAAFPATSWIFLYRDPVEILVSQLGHRGAHMVPGALPPELFGLDREALTGLSGEEYCARVLAAICEAALEGEDDRAMFVEYQELLGVVPAIAERFACDEATDVDALAARDAKNPALPFEPDAAAKQAAATPAVRAAADRFALEPYRRLEEARLRQRAAAC